MVATDQCLELSRRIPPLTGPKQCHTETLWKWKRREKGGIGLNLLANCARPSKVTDPGSVRVTPWIHHFSTDVLYGAPNFPAMLGYSRLNPAASAIAIELALLFLSLWIGH
jgi:hypothetical protein